MSVWSGYVQGIRTSIQYNSAAYGYSVAITATFGVVSRLDGSASVPDVFVFIIGAAAGFTIIEAAVTNMFRERMRGDRPEVVVLASAFALAAIGAGLGAATLAAWLLDSWAAWLAAPFAATVVYLAMLGVEMVVAHRAERAQRGRGESR